MNVARTSVSATFSFSPKPLKNKASRYNKGDILQNKGEEKND
jgi:hypothetical protein